MCFRRVKDKLELVLDRLEQYSSSEFAKADESRSLNTAPLTVNA